MLRTSLLAVLATVAFGLLQATAGETDSACLLEHVGRINLSDSPESDIITARGDRCRMGMIEVEIRKHDGTEIFRGSLSPHVDIGTSGKTEEEIEEDYVSTVIYYAGEWTESLPQIPVDIDYELWVEIETYERLQNSNAPAFSFSYGYAGVTYLVYDELVGRAFEAISYGT